MDDKIQADAIEVERYLRSMFDAMFEGIQILDSEWRYVYLNETAARHGRRSRDELIGRTMQEAYPGIDETEMFGVLERCMATREPQQMVNRFTFPSGEMAWFDLRVSPTPEGGLMILSIDVTAQRAADEMLHQSQKMEAVGRLAGGVAHDFNNVLSVITSYTDLILKRLEGDRFRRELQEVRRACDHAAGLTRQLLGFSRKRMVQPEVVDVNEVIGGLTGMLRRIIGEHIQLATDLTPDPHPVHIDPVQIQQVLVNLAVNARDAMPDGGTLTIRTGNVELEEGDPAMGEEGGPGPHLRVAVSDTGVGMDALTQERIFEPFFTTKERGRGTGLGLATAYGIVSQAGGSIRVDSEPGQGTTFTIHLPRTGQMEQAPASAMAPKETRARGVETVLVVDDDPAVRGVIRSVLEMAGYTVLETATVDGTLDTLRSHDGEIHLLLTDLVLPGMNGRELSRLALDAHPGLAVVYMSGYMDDSVANSGILEPGTPYIEKPFTADRLLEKVRAALG